MTPFEAFTVLNRELEKMTNAAGVSSSENIGKANTVLHEFLTNSEETFKRVYDKAFEAGYEQGVIHGKKEALKYAINKLKEM